MLIRNRLGNVGGRRARLKELVEIDVQIEKKFDEIIILILSFYFSILFDFPNVDNCFRDSFLRWNVLENCSFYCFHRFSNT